MAKMFYTMDEATKKLRCTDRQVMQYAREGRLREFKDGKRSMFKADQVDDLAADMYPSSDEILRQAREDQGISGFAGIPAKINRDDFDYLIGTDRGDANALIQEKRPLLRVDLTKSASALVDRFCIRKFAKMFDEVHDRFVQEAGDDFDGMRDVGIDTTDPAMCDIVRQRMKVLHTKIRECLQQVII